MRINKYLALKKISTRRGADELVEQKKVFINGKLAVLGSKVLEKDIVEVKGAEKKEYKYFAYNKPIGIETDSPKENLFPLGRLDKASHGLMILTNDGRITDQLLNPKYVHEKEYLVIHFHPHSCRRNHLFPLLLLCLSILARRSPLLLRIHKFP